MPWRRRPRSTRGYGALKLALDQADGGFARLNKVFNGKLEGLLGELADEVWEDAG